jgi:hypothetical protein
MFANMFVLARGSAVVRFEVEPITDFVSHWDCTSSSCLSFLGEAGEFNSSRQDDGIVERTEGMLIGE